MVFHNLKPGMKLAVAGLGGLGAMAVLIGKAMGAEVTVLTRSAAKKTGTLGRPGGRSGHRLRVRRASLLGVGGHSLLGWRPSQVGWRSFARYLRTQSLGLEHVGSKARLCHELRPSSTPKFDLVPFQSVHDSSTGQA